MNQPAPGGTAMAASSRRGDVIGGFTTFLTTAYIVVVNPSILATRGTGMSFTGTLTATVLVCFSMTLLMGLFARLPFAVAPLFEQWLTTHFPDRKEKVLNRLRSLRSGKLYDAQFGQRMTGEGIFADQIEQLFNVACRRAGIGRWPRFRVGRQAARTGR